jgi:hypothetical protein
MKFQHNGEIYEQFDEISVGIEWWNPANRAEAFIKVNGVIFITYKSENVYVVLDEETTPKGITGSHPLTESSGNVPLIAQIIITPEKRCWRIGKIVGDKFTFFQANDLNHRITGTKNLPNVDQYIYEWKPPSKRKIKTL